jgi:hypothetical protein
MITDNKLDIFERFVIDEKLQRKSYTIDSHSIPRTLATSFVVGTETRLGGIEFNVERKGFLTWLRSKFKPKPKYEMTIFEFFSTMKNSVSELIVVQGYALKYDAAIKKARDWGQVALAERMEQELHVARAEAQLLAVNSSNFLTEETVVKFAKKSPKGIRLDWIKNFARIIPDEIIEKKKMLDDRYIFDNYVIMHYDPEGKATQMTNAEIQAAKKDPILFGVVRNSRKLYYVGDWVDEHCNLTIAQMAEVLGSAPTDTLKGME